MNDIETDILIIGAGIAGSALACALRDSGLRVLAIDKSDQPLDTARGDHLQPHTCELLQRWGVLQDFFDAGAEKRSGAIWYTSEGECLLRSSVADLDIPHPYFAFINHEKIADVLLSAALSREGIDVIRPIRNWWLEGETTDHYTIRVGLPGGEDTRVGAKIVIGADGRNSRLRKTLAFEAGSHHYERGIIVFFATPEGENPGNFLRVYLGATSTTSVIPRTGGDCKIGFPIGRDAFAEWRRMSATEVEARLRQEVPALRVSSLRLGDIYSPVYLQTKGWVQGSAVLIGDACHAMHPARSQGMNISFRCVDVLADLLRTAGSTVRHEEVEKLLDHYQRRMAPSINATLRRNHELALQMDGSNPEINDKLRSKLEAIQSDADALQAYAMNAAGYGS